MDFDRTIGVIGLGYVGLPVATSFGRRGWPVMGFDIDPQRLEELRAGRDRTGEVPVDDLTAAKVIFTGDPAALAAVDFFIVTVPTPIDAANRPDLGALLAASETVGRVVRPGTIVVYESTVYPGVTEEECIPVLERASGLRAGLDFFVGYSPERINPGDPAHRFETILKIVAAQTPEALDTVAAVYGSVVEAGVYRASSIRVAEAAKVIENTQRDINIAFVNELAQIFRSLGLDTREVLAAAGTKWNFLPFSPGLVGGHCIGVDPYYLTFCAQRAGLNPEVILAGRRINDGIGIFVAQECVKMLMRRHVAGRRVAVLGLTFKENVPDVRNSRVVDIIHELRRFGLEVDVADPFADPVEVEAVFGITLVDPADMPRANAVVVAVAHRPYAEGGWAFVQTQLADGEGVVLDVKGILDPAQTPAGIDLWRL